MEVEDKALAKQPTAVPNMNSVEQGQPDEKAERLRGGCPFLPLVRSPFALCLQFEFYEPNV